jgi:hypothetical protein
MMGRQILRTPPTSHQEALEEIRGQRLNEKDVKKLEVLVLQPMGSL